MVYDLGTWVIKGTVIYSSLILSRSTHSGWNELMCTEQPYGKTHSLRSQASSQQPSECAILESNPPATVKPSEDAALAHIFFLIIIF